MFFSVRNSENTIRPVYSDTVHLTLYNWDDWFEFSTLYSVVYYDIDGVSHNVGTIKIGQFAMQEKQRSPSLPLNFDSFNDTLFSVGQDVSYYENLNNLGEEVRDKILIGLNDIALNSELLERASLERVTKISLFRSVSITSIKGQFRRLAQGIATLSEYQFTYTAPKIGKSSLPPISLTFHVGPKTNPPTNIHVLIGRNGVGKTHLLNNMIASLIDKESVAAKVGKFTQEIVDGEVLFANLVSVTFSAFDESEPPEEKKDKSSGIKYSYIGLKRVQKKGETNLPPKSPTILKNEFVKSVEACKRGAKNARWVRALEMLEADPIFKEAEVSKIASFDTETEFVENASNIFKKLSSGHKIVLLTITRLVETVEEKSLVLLDEPEAHLHPPLLSAFIRVLSDLLVRRNGVAIIATHSPVVLQEVPKSCVWKLRRSGSEAAVDRLEYESFGENVGSLTQEVFGLEVTDSGFHKLLSNAVFIKDDYNAVLEYFNNELGLEAKAIVRSLLASK